MGQKKLLSLFKSPSIHRQIVNLTVQVALQWTAALGLFFCILLTSMIAVKCVEMDRNLVGT